MSLPSKSCSTCGQALPDRHVEDFDWWDSHGLRIGYTNAGGYVQLGDRAGEDEPISVSPEFAVELAEALKGCALEVMRRREA